MEPFYSLLALRPPVALSGARALKIQYCHIFDNQTVATQNFDIVTLGSTDYATITYNNFKGSPFGSSLVGTHNVVANNKG